MLITRQFLFIRLLMLGLLMLMLAGAATAAPEPAMIAYHNIPVYGRDSAIDATMDVFLPQLASDERQRELGIELGAQLPVVLFVPELSGSAMSDYAQNLTARGYGVIAVHYSAQNAIADAMCALAWAHKAGPDYNLDPNEVVAIGFADGGRIAALMGSADLEWQPTYSGGAVRTDTPAPYVIAGLDRCPYTMPTVPMVEAVATYNAELDTPVALVDSTTRKDMLGRSGAKAAQVDAALDWLAFVPPDEWKSASQADVDIAMNTVDWRTLVPPEVAAGHEVEAPGLIPQTVLADVAVTLPAYWLNGSEPPHLLMVDPRASTVVRADNAIYAELLRDNGVPVQLQKVALGEMRPLDLFLADVFAGNLPGIELE
ncbi:MAG: hypothetical protein U0452_09255 [Anaerolineae bacterium]